jgi:geranylgeranyl diphosphate synthase type II
MIDNILEIEAWRDRIDEELAKISLPAEPVTLYEPVRYILHLGGKRIRPILTLLGCELFSEDIEKAMPAALAIEVFHNFTLVHDDIMDKAELRRGQPTVHTKWNLPTAILSGDVMLVKAYEILMHLDEQIVHPSMIIFNDAAKKVCEGQQLDMEFESRDQVSINNYIHMIGLKTGALLAASLTLGALAGSALQENALLIYDFGYRLGIAFQLQDDLLDAYGNDRFGKAIGGDIAANKKTFLTLQAIELANEQDRNRLIELYSHLQEDISSKIKEVMDIYQKLNIRSETEKMRDLYFTSAISALDGIKLNSGKKEKLRLLANSLLNREK